MSKHDEAIAAFHQGRSADALHLLQELLDAGETSDLWNDWAAVQLGAGRVSQAEEGFSRALELDPTNTDAIANLGTLLISRGDSARALPLLTSVLPLLPAGQRQIVNAMLARNVVEQLPAGENDSSRGRVLRTLVIADTFPAPHGDRRDLRLLQFLHTLSARCDEVTFIAREGVNRQQCEPLLRQAGIQTYSNDSERLPSLGRESSDSSWSFCELTEKGQFDIAILVQGFSQGISIPEHYLDDLRQHAPGIRIAVFVDELCAAPRESGETTLVDFERAQDWDARQWEIFERADAVLVRRERDAAVLRKSGGKFQVEVVTSDSEVVCPAAALNNILALTPKRYISDSFSVTLVETLFRDRLSPRSGEDRLLGQFECYARLAEQLLREDVLDGDQGQEQDETDNIVAAHDELSESLNDPL